MSANSSNHLKKGSTNLKSISRGDFNVGIKGVTDYGPSNQSGYFNGIVPTVGGYVIYVETGAATPTIHAPKNDPECLLYLKKYGATGTTIGDALAWAKHQTTIVVLSAELTACTSTSQNDAGTNSSTGHFTGGFTDLLADVRVGWFVNGPGVVDGEINGISVQNETISIATQQFVSGESYSFCLVRQHTTPTPTPIPTSTPTSTPTPTGMATYTPTGTPLPATSTPTPLPTGMATGTPTPTAHQQ